MITLTLRSPDLVLFGVWALAALMLAAGGGYLLARRAFRAGITVIVEAANEAESQASREALLDQRYTLSDAENN